MYQSLNGDFWTTESGIYHSRGSDVGFNTFNIIFDGTTLSEHSHGIVSQNYDSNTGLGVQRICSVLTFPDGTFEGEVLYKGLSICWQMGICSQWISLFMQYIMALEVIKLGFWLLMLLAVSLRTFIS